LYDGFHDAFTIAFCCRHKTVISISHFLLASVALARTADQAGGLGSHFF
jgi:hypothetical protein